MKNIAADNVADLESIETREWLDSLDYVLQNNGPARADQEAPFPGNQELERKIKSLVRWNAISMVVRANKAEPGIGGHISTFASAATLYEVGFNHFWRAAGEDGDRDVVYYQGHAAPGI